MLSCVSPATVGCALLSMGCTYMWSIELNVTQNQLNIFLKKCNIHIILQSRF